MSNWNPKMISRMTFQRGTRDAAALLALAFMIPAAMPAGAQTTPFYAGKNLTMLVGVQVGGTTDTIARGAAQHLKKYLPGAPNLVVQNMTGAGTNTVFNYFAERATPDGLTIVYSSYQSLAQALGDPSLRARFEDFEFLGGGSDTRVGYMKSDAVPGGMKQPSDIVKAPSIITGTYSNTDFEGTLSKLSLEALGLKYKAIIGYRGGADIFLAMQRNELNFHNTSLNSFRTRNAAFIRSGEGMGVYYLATVNPDGSFERNPEITEMPAFPDLYKQIYGKPPAGPQWDALNWLVSQTSELSYAAFAPKGTPKDVLAQLRAAFAQVQHDAEYEAQMIKASGLPFHFVDVERGQAIIRSLTQVSPAIVETLKDTATR